MQRSSACIRCYRFFATSSSPSTPTTATSPTTTLPPSSHSQLSYTYDPPRCSSQGSYMRTHSRSISTLTAHRRSASRPTLTLTDTGTTHPIPNATNKGIPVRCISSTASTNKVPILTFTGLKRSKSWDGDWFWGNRILGTTSNRNSRTREHMGREGNGVTTKGFNSSAVQIRGDTAEEEIIEGGDERENPGLVRNRHGEINSVRQGEKIGQSITTNTDSNSASNDPEDPLPPSSSRRRSDPDHPPPSERTINLGKAIRTLQSNLPTILQSPHNIPTSILSPQITLHLFPSSHPHLPTARGLVAYRAALWTTPLAWGQLPGRARLEIMSERVRKPCESGEELVVKWRTAPAGSSKDEDRPYTASTTSSAPPTSSCSSISTSSTGGSDTGTETSSSSNDTTLLTSALKNLIPSLAKSESDSRFTGLFIFSFDEKGRIVKHTIEHADEDWAYSRDTAGADREDFLGGKIIGVAEWLLRKAREGSGRASGEGGRARKGKGVGEPGLVFVGGDGGRGKERRGE